MRLTRAVATAIQGQRGALMPWCPVFMGLGVASFFAFPTEPGPVVFALALLAAALGLALAQRWREIAGPFAIGACFFAAGLSVAGLRAHLVAGPVLDFRYYGPIEGRVVAVDRSASDALRLTLDTVVLDRVHPAETPRRVRVSLFGDQGFVTPEPGARVMLTGHLSPPEGPAEPHGFDFQRHAWFLSLGAVGYTRSPVLLAEARPGGSHALTHLRLRLSRALQDRIPGQPGAFAAAVTTGDRSGLSPQTLAAMRGSNIAHLLAISGLHMGLLTGFVFAALRLGLAAIPAIALRFPIRKWAAAGALVAGAFYLALSGGNVATERAFVQVGVMLVAVLIDRRAITLRSVAIAALVVLLRRPETLMSPGFQMSFAATAALVAVFNLLRGASWLRDRPAWQTWLLALVISSTVAGAATAPFAASQFNIFSAYGLAANLVSVPIMGSVIIPAAVLAALLAPFGLAGPALWVMEQGLSVILSVAAEVTSWPGAVRMIVTPPGALMAAIILGGLFAILWQGRARLIGLLPVAAALLLWPSSPRPELLISSSGGLVGAMSQDGRALSRPRGDGFVAGIWLENDGDRADQAQAAARQFWAEADAGRSATVLGLDVWHATGRRSGDGAAAACAHRDIVIINDRLPEGLSASAPERLTRISSTGGTSAAAAGAEPGCILITPDFLDETGSIAISGRSGGYRIDTARAVQGDRLWSDPDIRRARGYDQ